MKAAVYVRVSTEEQVDGYSLDAQMRAAKAYCEKEQWDATFFEEPGASGTSTEKRPVFREMIARCKAHQFDVVLVHKLDRFARNREDAVVFKGLLKRAGIRVVSITEQFDDGPVGHMVEGIMECVAEWYSANLAVEVRKGQGERALAGKHHGRIPIGYCGEEGGQATVDETLGPVIREAFTRYATGLSSVRDLRLYILEKTGRALTVHSITRFLRNSFYIGKLNYHSEVLQGIHQPLISDDTFKAVQKMLDVRGHGGGFGRSLRVYELSGILLCDCGQPMAGHTTTNMGGKYQYFTYYHSVPNYVQTHKGYTLNATVADALAGRLLNRPIRPDWQTRIADLIRKKAPVVADARSEQKLSRAKELYITGDISREEFQVIKNSMAVKTETPAPTIDMESLQGVISLPAAAWDQAQPAERWARNKLLLKSIRMTKKEIVDYELTDLARAVFE